MIIVIALAFAMAFGYPLLVGAAILYGALVHHRSKLRRAIDAARSAIALGYSVDAVTELLLHHHKLPSMAVVRSVSSATGIAPADARDIVLRHVKSRRQREALARVPTTRFERRLDRFYPA